MKKLTRNIFSLLICLFFLITTATMFVGCGGDERDDGFVLTIGYDNGGYGLDWLENMVSKFCEANDIEREKVYIEAQKGITDVLNDRFSSEIKLRDIFISGSTIIREWASKGYLADVDSVFNATLKTGKTVKDSLTDSKLLECGHYKNHYYCLPSDGGAWGIYYNKTLFDQYGWTVPTTVAELMTLCQTILDDTNKAIAPFGCSSDITQYWESVVMNWSVQYMGIENFETFCKMESKELYKPDSIYAQAKLKALEAWDNLVTANNGQYVKKDSSNYEAIQSLFAQGRIAMMPNGNWFEHEILQALDGTGYEIAIMPTPAIDGARLDNNDEVIKVSYSGLCTGWVIPAKAAHVELAKKFFVFAVEEEQLRDYMVDCGGVLPYECDYSSIISKLTPCQKSVYEMVNNAYGIRFISSNPITYASAKIGVWTQGEPYGTILNGTKTPQQFIDSEWNYVNAEWDNLVRLANI